MSLEMLTLRCQNKDCILEIRIGRCLNQPNTRTDRLKYCPRCGQDAVVFADDQQNYWETLAKEYGVPVDAVVAIYGIWNPKEQPLLSEFVKEMVVGIPGLKAS